jgi:diadenosine tetraphosphate (Ap4A) HIT family hydrolase
MHNMTRHNIDSRYVWSILKEYKYWTLLLYDKPAPFLGRAVAWLAREGAMQRYSGLQDEELKELGLVLREYEQALQKLWQPDHINYLWLGNLFREHKGHGHMHIIPRYSTPREFDGVQFIDKRYGDFHFPYESPNFSRAQMEKVRDALRVESPN